VSGGAATVSSWTENDIARVFDVQRTRRWQAKTSSADERRELLSRLRAAVVRHSADAMAALHADLRRPMTDQPDPEIGVVIHDIDQAMSSLDGWMAPTQVDGSFPGTRAFIQYEARGVVLVFGPWNFPFALVLQPLVAALAAGNTAIVKPNELSPATAAVVATIINEACEESEVAVFEGGVDLAERLLELPVDHVFFTGSPAVARSVMAAAAKHLASVTLELGGKCPAIVDGSTDLADVVGSIALGKMSNAGQICLSPDHVYVRSDLRDEFVDAYMKQIGSTMYVDGSVDLEAMPRIVNERNFDRVAGYIDDAVERGAKLVGTGERDRETLTIHPVVLLDVPDDAVVMQEEIFGPVLPVFGYDSLDDVVDAIRSRPKPLAVYVYTADPITESAVLGSTSSGGVTINGWATHCADTQLPFGGVNHSGSGAYHGIYGFRELSHARGVVRHETA
jgi:aldehyde dehydrogenase (NAD+)